jgi:hypothetical protein
MRSGTITTDDIETTFYASQEYYLQHGNSDLGFVASLYSALLARQATASDQAFWANLVAQNGRAWVIAQFWSSPETISQRISAMYAFYLGRKPDAAGLAGWVSVALQIGDSGLRSALTSSDEYWNLSQTGTRQSISSVAKSDSPAAAPTQATTPSPAPTPTTSPTQAPATTPSPAPTPTTSPTQAPTPAVTPAPTTTSTPTTTAVPATTPMPPATPAP